MHTTIPVHQHDFSWHRHIGTNIEPFNHQKIVNFLHTLDARRTLAFSFNSPISIRLSNFIQFKFRTILLAAFLFCSEL